MTFSYPHADVDYHVIEDLRGQAAEVAPYYVKVLILDDAPQPGSLSGNRGGTVVKAASGIVADNSGHVVTAAHIALDTRYRASITTFDGNTYPAEIVYVDPMNELALLRCLIPLRVPAPLPYRAKTQAGIPVFAIGTPAGRPAVVTAGRVRTPRLDRVFRYREFGFDHPIVLSMHAEPGYSGGPAFDDTGRLIGMVVGFNVPESTEGDEAGTTDAYVIPAARVFEFLERWTPPIQQ